MCLLLLQTGGETMIDLWDFITGLENYLRSVGNP